MGSRHHDTADRRTAAVDCLTAGIDAAHPRRVVEETVTLDDRGRTLVVDDTRIDLAAIDDVLVAGGGNAAGHVAAALESILGDELDGGAVVTDDPVAVDRVSIREGTHPLPSSENVDGTRDVLAVADAAGADDLVLAVVTGGASALLAAPAADVALSDLREVTEALLERGADIESINAVRKHCSAVKGGRLAGRAGPARVVGLVLSDVIGDPLGVIASGPTAPDQTTYADAIAVLEEYDVTPPSSVEAHLERGCDGDGETPDADDPRVRTVDNHVLANADTAIEGAAREAAASGYDPVVLSTRVRGEARAAATTHVAVAEEIAATGRPVEPPAAVLSGGETTVTVRGDGDGGPNLEFSLQGALELDPDAPIVLGSVDTDGFDGGTDVAGAVVDGETVTDRGAATAVLRENDAGGFFAGRGELVRTGATGTNVNDLRILVVDDPDDYDDE
ncbi:glycerate kinase type-2 family protein [Natrialba aegyptia]|uniref:Hydroxypyruvate reductase n=1 Tax=Natrialba aegyptia DSM 13077 TaxID=1227491 RepID=M0AJZ9_9EURY|nr:DUF4147 domain-containing protein [Natrialba aegyptia]ELY97728.1 hydroxypyruvate reductase [Natrialba aegyptia DSM 13077]